MKITIAAASAPTPGRARRREIRDRGSRFGASGLAGAAEGSVTTDELMDCSWKWWGGGGGGRPRPPRDLDYRVLFCAYWTIGPMFLLSTIDGPVRTGWPPPMPLPLDRFSHSAVTDMYPWT